MVFPLVSFTTGYVRSSSPFCQISGFLLAVSFEACDVAVLLIVVHSALFVVFRNRPGGENGLYPYRRVVYAVAAAFPLLMASLAFVGGMPAYHNTGQSCYLSVTDGWYREYLSWVPRYAIFASIVVLKVATYGYVRAKMGQYSRRSSGAENSKPPPTPPLACNGLTTPPRHLRFGFLGQRASIGPAEPGDRKLSVLSLSAQPRRISCFSAHGAAETTELDPSVWGEGPSLMDPARDSSWNPWQPRQGPTPGT